MVISALLHLYFFKLESLDFDKEEVQKLFGVSVAAREAVKVWAYNQGFYNLFWSLGLFYSLDLKHSGRADSAFVLSTYLLLSIVGAALVLYSSKRTKVKAALVQGLPALLALVSAWIENTN